MLLQDALEHLGRNWGWVALRGLVAVLFGIGAFVWPGLTLAVLVLIWGAFALIDGVLALVAAFRIRDRGKPFWSLVVVGVLGIIAGVLTFIWPEITALALLMLIAAWAFVMGIFQIIAAIRLRKAIENEWLLGFSGVLSVIVGVLLFLRPGEGAVALIWVIAGYAVVFGVLLLILGFRLKTLHDRAPATVTRGH